MHAELKTAGMTSEQTLARQKRAIEDVRRKIEGLQAFQQQSFAAQIQRSTEYERGWLASSTQLLATQQNIEIKLDAVQAEAAVRTAKGLNTAPRQLSPARNAQSMHSLEVTASVVHWKCLNFCTCVCHRRSTIKSAQFLSRLFGLLFLGYAGLPTLTPSCDIKECIQRTSPAAVVSYHFPPWLLARVVSITMKASYFEGPQVSLRVSRVIDGASNAFVFAQRGTTDAVKELFQKRIVSPFDIGHTTGLSILTVSQTSHFECI